MADADDTAEAPEAYMSDKLIQKLSAKGLNFVHVNARSLLPKLDELRDLASKTKLAVIGITESWLDDLISDAEIKSALCLMISMWTVQATTK